MQEINESDVFLSNESESLPSDSETKLVNSGSAAHVVFESAGNLSKQDTQGYRKNRIWLCTLTREELLILCSLVLMDLLTNACLSIMAPIFPDEVKIL